MHFVLKSFRIAIWWEIFFDKGIIDTQELERSLSNSKYFQDENTPIWVRLWHFSDLSDDGFANLLKKVESEYSERQFLQLGVIKHIFGLFLMFSDAGLYCKSKDEILEDAKLYINSLRYNNQLALSFTSTIEDTFGGYGGLGFQGKEFREFKEFSSYIGEVQELARVDSMPSASKDLLITMQSDVWKFYRMICLSTSQNWEVSLQEYHEVPILKYIEPIAFIEKLLLMKSENQKYVFWALSRRYEIDIFNEKLIEELEWLKSVQGFLVEEASRRKGKLSGHCLEFLAQHYLHEAIKKLEAKRLQVQINQ